MSVGLNSNPKNQSHFELVESIISNNSLGGVEVTSPTDIFDRPFVFLSFFRNFISANGRDNLSSTAGLTINGDASVNFLNNVFERNRGDGVNLQMNSQSSVYLFDNEFKSNHGGPSLRLFGGVSFTCMGNNFLENRNREVDLLYVIAVGTVRLERNRFERNSVRTVIRLISSKNLTTIGRWNVFDSNFVLYEVVSIESELKLLQWTNNSFYDPSSGIEFGIDSRSALPVSVGITRNWWGENNSTAVRRRVRVPLSIPIAPVLNTDPQNLTSCKSSLTREGVGFSLVYF